MVVCTILRLMHAGVGRNFFIRPDKMRKKAEQLRNGEENRTYGGHATLMLASVGRHEQTITR